MSVAREIVRHAQQLLADGLCVGTSGNISVRAKEGFLITPTATPYEQLTADEIVHVDSQAAVEAGARPSSEWPFHHALYQARSDINAIVHTHSHYATAIACCREVIPSFHYMVAALGSSEIPLADYELYGSLELSKSIVRTLVAPRLGCLIANHGVIAAGPTLARAYANAALIEELAQQYAIARSFGAVHILSEEEMTQVSAKISRYLSD